MSAPVTVLRADEPTPLAHVGMGGIRFSSSFRDAGMFGQLFCSRFQAVLNVSSSATDHCGCPSSVWM